ncbi:hypothetical protein L226DRAFT_614632 [Lentinus tigrinus ALCF2SS1-7]|uniref:Uncharacterized protein n=1 Tax=Lentinus tigrinus ALCF2SS1-6 TaxID=1328759 RepID=A0A5C2S4L9_9APHY|nr:hypothetical protein L227DRAFT_576990 [Lentinus tigrinus ALCF2SS1-6]RPD72758.1 hypothetical protein L226DRAFT_614632 [Lentinus tigrinus ALCF2SS1-7]
MTARRPSSTSEEADNEQRPIPELLYSIRADGHEGLRLQHCVARLKESGLNYLDNFENAWTNVTRRLPRHGAVKLDSVRLIDDDEVLKFAHYLQVPANGKPLLLGHVVMQLADAQHREFEAVIVNETVQARLEGRVLDAEEARLRAGLPRFEDIYIMSIKRVHNGMEEHWYPEIVILSA